MKFLFFFAFTTLVSFASKKELFEIQSIERKWELVKTTNLNEKSVYYETEKTYFTFSNKEFTIISNNNLTQEVIHGTWDYVVESQTIDFRIENQKQSYKLIQLTEETLIMQHIDVNSGNRIQEEFIAGK